MVLQLDSDPPTTFPHAIGVTAFVYGGFTDDIHQLMMSTKLPRLILASTTEGYHTWCTSSSVNSRYLPYLSPMH